MILAGLSAPGDALAVVQADYPRQDEERREGVMERAVLLRYTALRFPGGSAVIISPRHALTARHGVQGWSPSQLTIDLVDSAGRAVGVERVWTHPDERVDLAVLRLASPVDFPRLTHFAAAAKPGDRVWLGGYGVYGPPGRPAGFGVFHSGFNTVTQVKNHRAAVVLDEQAAEPEALPAAIDSGSPVWVYEADAWRLSGVTVTATNSKRPGFGDRSSHQLIAPVRDWIVELIDQAPEPE